MDCAIAGEGCIRTCLCRSYLNCTQKEAFHTSATIIDVVSVTTSMSVSMGGDNSCVEPTVGRSLVLASQSQRIAAGQEI